MSSQSPEEAVATVDRAFSAGDLEAVLDFYEDQAVVTTRPGEAVRGKENLRPFFAEVMASRPLVRQLKTHVMEAEGIALFLSRWTLTTGGVDDPNSRSFIATTVLRRQPNGDWKG